MLRYPTILFILLFIVIAGAAVFFLAKKDTPQEIIIQNPITNEKSIINTDSIVAVAAGDIACGGNFDPFQQCAQSQTSDLVISQKPNLVLTLGDLQYPSGQYEYFTQFYDQSWGKFKNITFPVPGNHEYGTVNAQGYFDYFNGVNNPSGQAGDRDKGYYSYDQGEWHFIGLNSNCYAIGGCYLNSKQSRWLEEDLKNNQKKCTLVYWHHPLFSSGHYENNPLVAPFWEILYKNNVDIILNGHDHIYERFAPQDPLNNPDPVKGIRQFTVGTGGRNLYAIRRVSKNSEVRYNKSFGVLKLLLNKEDYSWEYINIDNETIDQGSAKCI